MIQMYNTAFSFKNSKYSANHFFDLTLIEDKKSLKKYVDAKLISMDHEENILFSKQNANNSVKVSKIFNCKNSMDIKRFF